MIGGAGAGHRPPDVVHLHWPESQLRHRNPLRVLLGLLRRLTLVVRARAGVSRFVWTAHNIGHHEHRHPRLERLLLHMLPRLVPFAEVLTSAPPCSRCPVDAGVLLPATPVFAELRDQVGADWVTLFGPSAVPGGSGRGAHRASRPAGARSVAFGWEVIAAATIDVYRRVMAAGRR